MPVITLNRVVFPAPFGPMMALRSPGMICSVTSRTACRPPKLLQRPFNSRTGISPFTLTLLIQSSERFYKMTGAPVMEPRLLPRLFAVFAGREVAIVDRLREEFLLAIGPELADVRIGLD